MKRTTLLLALASGLLFASCKKSSDDPAPGTSNTTNNSGNNPSGTTSKETQLSYQVKAMNANATIAQKPTAAPFMQWKTATAIPTLVKFEAKKGNSEIEYKSTNSAQVDLMSLSSVSFGSFTIPSGTYSEIELKIQLDKNSSGPALKLTGEFSNGTVTIPVEFVVNEFMEIKTEQHNITVADSSTITAVTTLDLSSFTSGIKESMILSAQLTNGTLVISSSSNNNLYSIIVSNLNTRHHMEMEQHHK